MNIMITKLDEILNAVTNFTYDAMAHPGDPLVGTLPTMDKATAKKELLAIIRTEKLKLLDEVRERAIPNPTTPAGENELVQLEVLTKLEAEL